MRDGDFVGVAAPDEPRRGARRWPRSRPSGSRRRSRRARSCSSTCKKNAGRRRRRAAAAVARRRGLGRRTAWPRPTTKLDATYTIAYIAHAPLEPRAAVAEWEDGKLTVWTGTQRPFGVRGELAEAFRMPEDKVRVIVPDTGSGYGGKHTGEAAVEAARLAKAAGKPVKLVWTREEEFTWAYFRPAGVIDVQSGARRGRHAHRLGVPQLQLRRLRHPHALRRAQPADRVPRRRARRCGRARTAAWPRPPTTSPARRHMDELAHARRAWTRWSSACRT